MGRPKFVWLRRVLSLLLTSHSLIGTKVKRHPTPGSKQTNTCMCTVQCRTCTALQVPTCSWWGPEYLGLRFFFTLHMNMHICTCRYQYQNLQTLTVTHKSTHTQEVIWFHFLAALAAPYIPWWLNWLTDCVGFRALQNKPDQTYLAYLTCTVDSDDTDDTDSTDCTDWNRWYKRYKRYRQQFGLTEIKGWLSIKPFFAHRAVSQSLWCFFLFTFIQPVIKRMDTRHPLLVKICSSQLHWLSHFACIAFATNL